MFCARKMCGRVRETPPCKRHVSVPSFGARGHQSAILQLAQMRGCRGLGQPRYPAKFRHGQRAAPHQGLQHGGTCGITDQRGKGGDVGGMGYGHSSIMNEPLSRGKRL